MFAEKMSRHFLRSVTQELPETPPDAFGRILVNSYASRTFVPSSTSENEAKSDISDTALTVAACRAHEAELDNAFVHERVLPYHERRYAASTAVSAGRERKHPSATAKMKPVWLGFQALITFNSIHF